MASKDPLIVSGEHVVDLLSKGKYSRPHLLALIQDLETGAKERSAARVEKHIPDEWQGVIAALWHIRSSLEKKGVSPDPKQVANLADALKAAERRGE